jgi:hypothetical protein
MKLDVDGRYEWDGCVGEAEEWMDLYIALR